MVSILDSSLPNQSLSLPNAFARLHILRSCSWTCFPPSRSEDSHAPLSPRERAYHGLRPESGYLHSSVVLSKFSLLKWSRLQPLGFGRHIVEARARQLVLQGIPTERARLEAELGTSERPANPDRFVHHMDAFLMKKKRKWE